MKKRKLSPLCGQSSPFETWELEEVFGIFSVHVNDVNTDTKNCFSFWLGGEKRWFVLVLVHSQLQQEELITALWDVTFNECGSTFSWLLSVESLRYKPCHVLWWFDLWSSLWSCVCVLNVESNLPFISNFLSCINVISWFNATNSYLWQLKSSVSVLLSFSVLTNKSTFTGSSIRNY